MCHVNVLTQTDPHECEQACETDSACRAWTYVGEGGDTDTAGYPVPRCCLKNGTHLTPTPDRTCTSGIKAAGNAPTQKGYTALLVTVGADGAADSSAALYHVDGSSNAKLIDRAGKFKCGDSVQCGVATVTGLTAAEAHTVVLMLRKGMFEVYIDKLLVQSFVCASHTHTHTARTVALAGASSRCRSMSDILMACARCMWLARWWHLSAIYDRSRRPLRTCMRRCSCCQGDGEQGVEDGPARVNDLDLYFVDCWLGLHLSRPDVHQLIVTLGIRPGLMPSVTSTLTGHNAHIPGIQSVNWSYYARSMVAQLSVIVCTMCSKCECSLCPIHVA
jgi:hypothetical protein